MKSDSLLRKVHSCMCHCWASGPNQAIPAFRRLAETPRALYSRCSFGCDEACLNSPLRQAADSFCLLSGMLLSQIHTTPALQRQLELGLCWPVALLMVFFKLMNCAWRPPSDCSPRERITHLGMCVIIRNFQGFPSQRSEVWEWKPSLDTVLVLLATPEVEGWTCTISGLY